MQVNIHQAKTNLSRLIVRAEAGEEVVIARAGKPAIKLVPVQTAEKKKFKFGALKGRMNIPDSFFESDPELEALFCDGPIFPDQKPGEVAVLGPIGKDALTKRPTPRQAKSHTAAKKKRGSDARKSDLSRVRAIG